MSDEHATKQLINIIPVRGTSPRQIEAEVIGKFAIHPRQGIDGPIYGWTITHMQSGLSIWRVEHEQDARACARYLNHNNILPDGDAFTLKDWAANQIIETQKLHSALSSIAAKYPIG